MGHLCEFYLLKHHQESELRAFLKRSRIPGMRAYVKQLRAAFSESAVGLSAPE